MSILAILFSLVVWGLVFWLLWWGQGKIGVGEPFDKVITVVLVLAAIYVVIGLLMGFVPVFPFFARIV